MTISNLINKVKCDENTVKILNVQCDNLILFWTVLKIKNTKKNKKKFSQFKKKIKKVRDTSARIHFIVKSCSDVGDKVMLET